MKILSYLYLFFTLLFLQGCGYKLIHEKELNAIDERLAQLQGSMPRDISQDLETKLNEKNEKLQFIFLNALNEQNKTIETLSQGISKLTKSLKNLKSRKKTQTKKPPQVEKIIPVSENKLIVGSIEKVHIYPSDFIMNARIDTGAETSSIHANDIERFERDGKRWVRFTLFDEKTNKTETLERKVVRGVKIIQSSLENDYERRVVVTLEITIGDKKELSEFTLTNREHMQYPILIGRNVLQDLIIVDVSEKYIAPLKLDEEDKFKK